MAYTIKIGRAVFSKDKSRVVDVVTVEKKDAPDNGDYSHKTNERWPAYAAWSNFAENTGLHGLMFTDHDALIGRHMGEGVILTERHYQTIHNALEAYRAKYPTHRPGYESPPEDEVVAEFYGVETWLKAGSTWQPDPDIDGNLDRLIWVDWWVRYSLDHYKHPAFYAS